MDERIVALEESNKSRDREIKELKEKIDALTNNQNSQLVINQKILSEQEYTNKTLQTIVVFMEDIKAQPKKDKDSFTKAVIGAIIVVVVGACAYTIGIRTK